MSSFVVIKFVLSLLVIISSNAQANIGQSLALTNVLGFAQIADTDTTTFTIDNANFSRGQASSAFRLLDTSKVTGNSTSVSSARRGTDLNTTTSLANGYANSFASGVNQQGNGVFAVGASLIDTFATPNSAGLNGSAAVEGVVYNGDGYIVFQNQAGGVATTEFGTANYNYTSRFNASGENATVADFINVQLVSNKEQVGSSLTLCQGNAERCSVFTPGI